MEKVKKVVVYPCGGIGFPLSSVARYAAFVVTEDLLPGKTEIVDAVRLINGFPDEVELVENNPTIIIDGCGYHCGSNLFRLLGIKPAARILATVISKLPPTFVAGCTKKEINLSPGRERRVPSESGKNLAREIAVQVKTLALIMLNPPYHYKKQRVNTEKTKICEYIDDPTLEFNYIEVKEGIYRPTEMPKLSGLEP